MSVTLPKVERLSTTELAAYKAAIETEQTQRAQKADEAKRFLAGSVARLQDMVARLNAGEAQPVASNGNGQHKVAKPTAQAKAVKAIKRRKGKAPAKYRNPENKDQTWSGHGPTPGWMSGKPKEQFLIA